MSHKKDAIGLYGLTICLLGMFHAFYRLLIFFLQNRFLRGLARAFVARKCDKYQNLMYWLIMQSSAKNFYRRGQMSHVRKIVGQC